MSFASSQDAKEQIRQAIDIVDLIGSYMPLRHQGRIFVGNCPFHDDTRPSLQVNPERQSWKCWVCDVGGDIFSFVMQREQVDFREALMLLADRAGVELTRGPKTQPGDPNDKRTLYDAVRWASQLFSDYLQKAPEAEVARRYFEDRGIAGRSLERFQLGFSPNRWQWLLDRSRNSKFSPAVLEAAGLLGRSSKSNSHYDRFKGRVIFPIRDSQQRPIAFGGRILPEYSGETGAKYVNSPETRLFSKSEHVYGLDIARDTIARSREVLVVEGYTDVIMCHQHGIENVVAVLGTALGPRHIRHLRRYADAITLVLDGDEAGQRRTNEVLELFIASEVDLRILTLPEGLDPCDFVAQRGAEAMRVAVKEADDAFAHAIRIKTEGVDLLRDTHRANQALEQLLGILAQAPRFSADTTTSRRLRERQVLSRLARDFRLEEAALRDRLAELREKSTSEHATPPPTAGRIKLEPVYFELFGILVTHPDLTDVALAEIEPSMVTDATARTLLDVYSQVIQECGNGEFSSVLLALEDPRQKNLLVDIDEQARAKEPLAQEDAAARLRRLIDDLQMRADATQRRQTMAALEQRKLSEEEELGVLQDLIEKERKRQGIPAPTDG